MSKNNTFRALDYRTNKPISVDVEKGKICAISEIIETLDTNYFVAPGLVDLQINGFKGIDFNSLDLKITDVHEICNILLEKGITSFYPTVITNSSEAIELLLTTISTACNNSKKTDACIGGIHLEGPFISFQDGPRGAHSKEFVQAPNWDLFEKWQKAANGKIKIITLSPEWENSTEFIEKCIKSGVIVSIGHTAATPEQIQNAINSGATMSTHLGNGCHAMLPRHKNYIFEQLASEKLWSTLIADGFHLPDSLLKIFLKTKPNKSILVSDATSFAGLPSGTYKSHIGGDVELNDDGKLCIQGNFEMLAGSAQSLLWCVNQLVKKQITSLQDTWNMASIKPTEALFGTSNNFLEVGYKADFVLFEKNKKGIQIKQTIKDGKIVFSDLIKNS